MALDKDQAALLQAIGANVRRLRIEADLTQEKLAELVGINPRTVQKIEAGKLNILVTTFSRIQGALGCQADQLLPAPKRSGKKTKGE